MKTLSKPSIPTLATTTRPEVELLLCCARTCINSETAEQIQALLQKEIDWEYLIQLAYQHGVIPLLYSSLNTACPAAVPQTIFNQLQNRFYENTKRNLFLARELLNLLDLFAAHDIPVIPYKGPALAVMAYGDLALRQFGDLDIVVHERDVIKARELLISQGYQLPVQFTMAQEKPYLQSEQFRESAQCDGSYNIIRNDGKVMIELHWKLTQKAFPFPIALEKLWKKLKPLSLAGTTVLNFPPEDMLLILCMHGTKDAWKQLKWICDIAELIRTHQQMDWEQVLQQADTLGSRRMLLLGLLLANVILDAALPREILQKMQADPVLQGLAARLREQLFYDTDEFETENKYLLHLRARERLQDRAHVLFHVLMTPSGEDWEFLPLPTYLYSLYYPLRPIRLMGRYGLSSLKYLLGL